MMGRRHFAHTITATAQKFPELRRCIGRKPRGAGEATADADNGNRLALAIFKPLNFLARLAQGQEDLL